MQINKISSQQSQGRPWEVKDWLICAVLVFASIFLVALHNRTYPTLSPIDEIQHLDYTFRASSFDFPRPGERIGQEVMREAACRSVEAPKYISPPCGLRKYKPSKFQEKGYNTAAAHMPTYYVITGILARGIKTLTPIDSMVSSARYVGGLWLGVALSVIWYIGALLHIKRSSLSVVLGLLISTPLVVFHSSTVNPDASLLLAGSLTLLITIKYQQERLRAGLFFAILVLLVTLDESVLLGIFCCWIFLFVQSLATVRSSRKIFIWVYPFFLIFIVTQLLPSLQGFLQPNFAESYKVPMLTIYEQLKVSWPRVFDQKFAVLTPIRKTWMSPSLRVASVEKTMQVVNGVLVIGMLWGFTRRPRKSTLSLLAGSSFVMMLLAGPLFTFYRAYADHVNFTAGGRFGFTLLPMATLAVTPALDKKSIFWFLVAVSLFSFFNTIRVLI